MAHWNWILYVAKSKQSKMPLNKSIFCMSSKYLVNKYYEPGSKLFTTTIAFEIGIFFVIVMNCFDVPIETSNHPKTLFTILAFIIIYTLMYGPNMALQNGRSTESFFTQVTFLSYFITMRIFNMFFHMSFVCEWFITMGTLIFFPGKRIRN